MKYIYEKKVPFVACYDVAVAGGGLAGIGAACASARAGARTILIERSGQLGGMASLAGVGSFCNRGPLSGQGVVFDTILKLLKDINAIGAGNGWPVSINEKYGWQDHQFDHNMLPVVLQKMLAYYGVEVLYHTDVIDVLRNTDDSCESDNIKVGSNRKCYLEGVIIYNKSLIQAISAKVIVDATGDGLVSQCSGAKILDIKDPLYPELLPPCFYIYMCEGKVKPWNEKPRNTTTVTPLNQIPDYKILEEPDGRICLKIKGIPGEFDYGRGKDFSEAERTAKNLIPDILDDVWRKGYKNKVFNYYPGMIGIREGRRIEGDYILTINDVRENRVFPDSVAYCEFTVDTGVFHEVVPGFQIPYRSLIVKNTGNLLVAGRCFSADRLTMSAARIMITCCMMGQAAGYAAAEACRNNMDIREINTGHIRKMLTDGSEDSETMMMKLEKGVF